MMVLVVNRCPQGLRGFITRWLLEISPGVYVGKPNFRVREALWNRTIEMIGDGRALMVENAQNEQGFCFRVHNYAWNPVDLDGMQLIIRSAKSDALKSSFHMKRGWSLASKRRSARKKK